MQANLRYPDSIAAALRKADAGILRQSGAQSFDAVHRLSAQNIVMAAREAGIESLVHVSAVGADPSSSSLYARSKAIKHDRRAAIKS